MSKANNTQEGGDHYKTSIEHWDYVVANDLDYFQAQICKYITRHKKKNQMKDLDKAEHFLKKYKELYATGALMYNQEGESKRPVVSPTIKHDKSCRCELCLWNMAGDPRKSVTVKTELDNPVARPPHDLGCPCAACSSKPWSGVEATSAYVDQDR